MGNRDVLIMFVLIPAHPHLYVVSGGLWQLLVEPWRVVEGTTGTVGATPSPIPQGTTVLEKH